MKIAIVGANSYLGRNFRQYLLDNHPECCIDLYGSHNKHADGDLRYRKVNILDKESLKDLDFAVDSIFVFSGMTGTIEGFDAYPDFISLNETGLVNVLDMHRKTGSQARVVYPSSRLVYAEKKRSSITETDRKDPKSVYAITKLAAEHYIKLYANCFGTKYCILRMCTPFGTLIDGAQSYGTYSLFRNQALERGTITVFGNGEGKKTYTHISDICHVLYEAAGNAAMENEIFNIGGVNHSLNEFASAIADELDCSVEYVKWPDLYHEIDGGETVLNSDKIASILDIKYQEII